MELIAFRLLIPDDLPVYDEALSAFRQWYVRQAMHAGKGNQCRAAEIAGVHRNTLSRLMTEHGVDPKTGRVKTWRKKAVSPKRAEPTLAEMERERDPPISAADREQIEGPGRAAYRR